ncbi:TPA: sugar transferase [Campylobacter coli]|nr:sugar transferase [Campylobacter coli]
MNSETNKQSGIIGFLLLPQDEKLEEINFTEEEVHIQDKYNFTHLSTYLKDFKIFTEQYNKRQDPIKLAPLQKQIQEKDKIINSLTQEKQKVEQDYKTQIQILNNKKNELQNELKSPQIKKVNLELLILEQDLFNKKLEGQKLAKSLGIKTDMMDSKIIFVQANSAKARIQNHLAYKIGQVLIQNSKNLWGYIRMPFILSYIKDKYNKEQSIYKTKIKENPNLALPPLESYPDYKEALKEKECFTYKLGEAFIQANQNWYKGGYISFYFKDMPRLKREKLKKEKI